MLSLSQVQTGGAYRNMMRGTFVSESLFHQYIPSCVPESLAWGSYVSKPDRWFYLCAFHGFKNNIPSVDPIVSIVVQFHNSTQGKSPTGQFGFQVPTHLGNMPTNNE